MILTFLSFADIEVANKDKLVALVLDFEVWNSLSTTMSNPRPWLTYKSNDQKATDEGILMSRSQVNSLREKSFATV